MGVRPARPIKPETFYGRLYGLERVYEPRLDEIRADIQRALFDLGPQASSQAPGIIETSGVRHAAEQILERPHGDVHDIPIHDAAALRDWLGHHSRLLRSEPGEQPTSTGIDRSGDEPLLGIATQEWLARQREWRMDRLAQDSVRALMARKEQCGYEDEPVDVAAEFRESVHRHIGADRLDAMYHAEREEQRRRADVGLPPLGDGPATRILKNYVLLRQLQAEKEIRELARQLVEVALRPLSRAEKRARIRADLESGRFSKRAISRRRGVDEKTVRNIANRR